MDSNIRVLAGIDLPADFVCGSMLLAADIYGGVRDLGGHAEFLCLRRISQTPLVDGSSELDLNREEVPAEQYGIALGVAVAEAAAKIRPTVVHLNHLIYGMSAAMGNIEYGCPVIAIAHGTDVYDIERNAVLLREAQATVDRADRVVFPSQALYAKACELGLVMEPGKSRVLWWAVPDRIAQYKVKARARTFARSNRSRVVVACRLTKNKNVGVVLHALSSLDSPVELHIIGSGPEREQLGLLADLVPDRHEVRFREPMAREEYWRELATFDLAVFPTAEVEAFGLFGLECARLGVPLVCSDLPVFAEVFPASPRFDPESPHELAAQMELLISDKQMAGQVGDEAFRLSAQYSMSSVVEALCSVARLDASARSTRV